VSDGEAPTRDTYACDERRSTRNPEWHVVHEETATQAAAGAELAADPSRRSAGRDVPTLFEPFCRVATTERLANSTEVSTNRGAGLGLSIVRSVAHAHGGDVHATPREGGGLRVHVRLPAGPPNP
jgi:hypothetical protein